MSNKRNLKSVTPKNNKALRWNRKQIRLAREQATGETWAEYLERIGVTQNGDRGKDQH